MQRVTFNLNRTATVIAIVMLCSLLIIVSLFHNSTVINGVNTEMDNRKTDLTFINNRENTTEGSFVDRNNYAITYAEAKGVPATIQDSTAFSSLIGYNSIIYGVSDLRQTYSEQLFEGGNDSTGATIQLTVDASLQRFCYNLLNGTEGSCTVLDAESGEILALASRSSASTEFDANNIDSLYSDYSVIDGFFLNRAIRAVDPPGSTFKIVTATAMLENGKEDYTYEDNGAYTIGGVSYYNFNNESHGATDLTLAMKKSSNVYFASAGVKLGIEKLYATANNYMYGKPIELDFCTLYSNFEKSDIANPSLLAQTAYGQGKILISPLQLAMQMQAVMNEGTMLKPYLIKSITNDGKIDYSAKTKEELSKVTDKDNVEKICQILKETAKEYELYDSDSDTIIAKTGTADLYNKTNAIYLTCGLSKDDKKFAICISSRNTDKTSSSLVPVANSLLEYLKTAY